MTYIASSFPNLINGISEQPPEFRLATQADKQLNGVSSVISGLEKRPPTEFISSPNIPGFDENTFVHLLDYGNDVFYTVIITTDTIHILDNKGLPVSVLSLAEDGEEWASDADDGPNPLAYLKGLTNPRKELKATTIADQTYIINKSREVKIDEARTEARPFEALIYIKQGDYETQYKITIRTGSEGREFSYTTRDSSNKAHEPDIQTTNITTLLHNSMKLGVSATPKGIFSTGTSYLAGDVVSYGENYFVADVSTSHANEYKYKKIRAYQRKDKRYNYIPNTTGSMWTQITYGFSGARTLPAGLDVSMEGNTIRVWSTDTDFTIDVTDDRGGTHAYGYKGQVKDFKTLPPKGPKGFEIKVMGNNEKRQDDYYVKLVDVVANGQYVWKETTGPELPFKLDKTTMPHQLVREPDGTFFLRATQWADRTVGDEETNPMPSVVGQKINDLFFYKNRLGLLSGENVLLSEVGGYWNFFHNTTIALLDSSPIDIAVSTDTINILKYAVPFNASLMLFSDNVQFMLDSGQVLAYDTVSVDVSTRFGADLGCAPKGSATFVFFATTVGSHGGMREFYVAADTDSNDAEDITSHIPTLIEGGIKKIAVTTAKDMLVALGTKNSNVLYAYNYFWSDKQKKQSAWHKWDLKDPILDVEFIGSKLMLFIDRPDGISFETLEMAVDPEDAHMSYNQGLLLDRRAKLTATPATPYPTLPYPITSDVGFYDSSGALKGTGWAQADVIAHYNHKDTTDPVLYLGNTYPFEYTFGEFLVRQEGRAIHADALKLKTFQIAYSDTATFEVRVDPHGGSTRATYSKAFTPTIGSSATRLNTVNTATGEFRVPIWGASKNIRVTILNDTPFRSSFQTAEWTAMFSKHARTQ